MALKGNLTVSPYRYGDGIAFLLLIRCRPSKGSFKVHCTADTASSSLYLGVQETVLGVGRSLVGLGLYAWFVDSAASLRELSA